MARCSHLGQWDVHDVSLRVARYALDQARLPGPRRSVQQQPAESRRYIRLTIPAAALESGPQQMHNSVARGYMVSSKCRGNRSELDEI